MPRSADVSLCSLNWEFKLYSCQSPLPECPPRFSPRNSASYSRSDIWEPAVNSSHLDSSFSDIMTQYILIYEGVNFACNYFGLPTALPEYNTGGQHNSSTLFLGRSAVNPNYRHNAHMVILCLLEELTGLNFIMILGHLQGWRPPPWPSEC